MFAPGGAVVSTMDFFSDLVILNVLCVVCSLPLFTLPASLSAAFRCTQKLLRGEGSGTARMFFRAWREEFRSVTLPGVVTMAIGVLLDFELRIVGQMPVSMVFRVALTAALLVWLGVTLWLLPVRHHFQRGWKDTLKLSAVLAIANLPRTLVMMLTVLIPWLAARIIVGAFGVVLLLSLILLVEGAVLVSVILSQNVLETL